MWRHFETKGELVVGERKGISAEELGRRLAREKDVIKDTASLTRLNAVFDSSGRFLLYPSVVGVHVVEVETKRELRVYGERETAERFLIVAYMEGGGEEGGLLLASSFESQRIYLFNSEDVAEERDVFNERPMVKAGERSGGRGELQKRRVLAKRATLHTTKGDIVIELLGGVAPKAVENFETHSRNGYYNRVVFHRVIKGFMLQTGDPEGDGAGGESIWGGEFEDEIDDKVTHETGTVSMANAGPNTNGSVCYQKNEMKAERRLCLKSAKGALSNELTLFFTLGLFLRLMGSIMCLSSNSLSLADQHHTSTASIQYSVCCLFRICDERRE